MDGKTHTVYISTRWLYAQQQLTDYVKNVFWNKRSKYQFIFITSYEISNCLAIWSYTSQTCFDFYQWERYQPKREGVAYVNSALIADTIYDKDKTGVGACVTIAYIQILARKNRSTGWSIIFVSRYHQICTAIPSYTGGLPVAAVCPRGH